MVSPIKFFKADPSRRGRGAGLYYKRTSISKGWFSKFTEMGDGVKKSKEVKFTNAYRHTGDAKPSKMTTRKVGRGVFKGWF